MAVRSTSNKKASSGGQTNLSAAEIAEKLKGKKKVFDRSKKKDAPQGYVEDAEVVKMFSLKAGQGITQKAQLRSVSVVEINDALVFKMKFTVYSGEHKGTPLQEDIWLNLDDDEKLEKAMDSIVFMLQKLGYDTDELELDQVGQVAEDLTEEKPYCVIYISAYKRTGGKNKGKMSYGVRINSAFEPEQSEESEDEDVESEVEDDDEDDEESEYESEEENLDEEEDGDDEEEYDEEDDDEKLEEDDEELSDEGEFDEEDPSTWEGYICKAKPKRAKKVGKYEITSYNKKTKKLSVENVATGTKATISPDQVIDWVEE